jgi:hypothetical protein
MEAGILFSGLLIRVASTTTVSRLGVDTPAPCAYVTPENIDVTIYAVRL